MANGATSTGGPGTENINLSGPFASDYIDLSKGLGISMSNNLQKTSAPDVSKVYSGADVFAYITPYASNITNTPYIPLKNLLTFSYSTHRDKLPVRRLGSPVAFDYTKGTRTIAGALVMLNFDRTALSELIMGSDIYGEDIMINMFDDIPPFDITLLFTDELQGTKFMSQEVVIPSYSVIEVKGVRLLDEGLVTGTNEAYLETTFQYVAEDIKYLKPMRGPTPVPSVPVDEESEFDLSNIVLDAPLPVSDLPKIAPPGVMEEELIADTCSDTYPSGPQTAIDECYISNVWSTFTNGGIGVKFLETINGVSFFTPLVVFPTTKAEWEQLQGITGGLDYAKAQQTENFVFNTASETLYHARTVFAEYCQDAFDNVDIVFSGCAGTE